jgi:hypothetical protein
MKKFGIVKRFSLDFLGEGWKDAYINFSPLTIVDIKTKFPSLLKLSAENKDDVIKGVDSVLIMMKEKFVDGKAVESSGGLVDLTVDDLEQLPVEVLSRALSFLSQGATPSIQAPSGKS